MVKSRLAARKAAAGLTNATDQREPKRATMLNIVWGSHKDKPQSSARLAETLALIDGLEGYLYIGYPIMGSPVGPVRFDALLVSTSVGLVAFDLVEGTELLDFEARQDEVATMLEVKLKPYPDLKRGRDLKFDVNAITFAPAKAKLPDTRDGYFVSNGQTVESTLRNFSWSGDSDTFAKLLAAIQVVTSIRAGKLKREPKRGNSRGARLKKIEESIANLDQHQSRAVIETVEGIQRIRGLAGSGKTIVLALKVAYLHSQNSEWRIAVTFNTRSLKEQFKRLINNFTIEQTGSEPDWDLVEILNAWGGPGGRERDGIYHKFCRQHEIPFLDYGTARAKFGEGKEFAGACAEALEAADEPRPMYDLVLVDEAQDLPASFLRLCFASLSDPKRLVYAYDELQSLTGNAVLPPEELFGKDATGAPLVRLAPDDGHGPTQDIILEKCYRNSRPLLATAHALGFGIYRKSGLVQFFERDTLWEDVGYVVAAGQLVGGSNVTLARTPDTSPLFLEDHSPPDDLIQFRTFKDSAEQTEWLVESIAADVRDEELRPEDIVVINPNPLTTQKAVGPARALLLDLDINSELAGVSTSADIFMKSGAVTFTGIFRAKGNEAGMVYIINGHDCFSGFNQALLQLARNRLFTAITRSKAWVRVVGIGPSMDRLTDEWRALRDNDYRLTFVYPTPAEKKELRLIDRDIVRRPSARLSAAERKAAALLNAVRQGDIDPDAIIESLKAIKAKRGPQ